MSRTWLARACQGFVTGHGFEIDPGPCAQLAELLRKGLRPSASAAASADLSSWLASADDPGRLSSAWDRRHRACAAG
jgi:hypothetical protein